MNAIPDPASLAAPGPSPLDDLVDDAIHDEVVRRRALRRGLADRATESATWTGTLCDLAERRAEVTVHLAGGRTHRGRLTAVAADHLVVTGDGSVRMLVAASAVRWVRPQTDLRLDAVQGDRRPADDRTLAEALEELLVHGADVALGLRDVAEGIRGRVEALGEDLLTVRTPAGGAVLVPFHGVADVVWGAP